MKPFFPLKRAVDEEISSLDLRGLSDSLRYSPSSEKCLLHKTIIVDTDENFVMALDTLSKFEIIGLDAEGVMLG